MHFLCHFYSFRLCECSAFWICDLATCHWMWAVPSLVYASFAWQQTAQSETKLIFCTYFYIRTADVVVFFFPYNQSWTSLPSIVLSWNSVSCMWCLILEDYCAVRPVHLQLLVPLTLRQLAVINWTKYQCLHYQSWTLDAGYTGWHRIKMVIVCRERFWTGKLVRFCQSVLPPMMAWLGDIFLREMT